ncbi:MAG: ribosome small subunit-dependent GTPase A [Chloroflexota bacterium]
MPKQLNSQHDDVTKYEEYDDYGDYRQRGFKKPKPKRKSKELIPGIVVRGRGHHYDVQTWFNTGGDTGANTGRDHDPNAENGFRLCRVRGRLLQEKQTSTLVAVGDRVKVLPNGTTKGQIEEIEERETALSRRQPFANPPMEDVILANPDQVLIVFAIQQPDPHLRMLDRFLVIAEYSELPAIICVNKVDLVEMDYAKQTFGLYEEIGYDVCYTSTETGEGLDKLRTLMHGQTSVLSGPSGVGKSSLLNALYPQLNLDTGELRDFLGKGRHTTRAAHLLQIPTKSDDPDALTFVADTPGIRELGLFDIETADLGFCYKEIEPFVNDCHFPNCTHDHEPGCAVRQAVEDGHVTHVRYDSYLRLMRGEHLNTN